MIIDTQCYTYIIYRNVFSLMLCGAGRSEICQILPIYLGDLERTFRMRRKLQRA